MKTQKKILRIGGSKAITLPRELSETFLDGDIAIFSIEVIENLGQPRNHRCKACNHIFFTEPQEAYCPVCNCEELEIVGDL